MKQLTVGSLKISSYKMFVADYVDEKTDEPTNKQEDVKIEIKQNNKSFQVVPISNELLLDSALQQGIPLEYKCRKGSCGRCAVEVLEGYDLLCPLTNAEIKKLQHSKFRLACQARVK